MEIIEDNVSLLTDTSSNRTYTCDCGKKYKNHSGLYKHKQKCSLKIENEKVEVKEKEFEKYLSTISSLEKENYQLKEKIYSQELQIKQYEKDLIRAEMKIEFQDDKINELRHIIQDKIGRAHV